MMETSSTYNFHDQAVTAFSLEQGNVNLVIDCYDDNDKRYKPVSLLFTGVDNLTIDNVPHATLSILRADGEMVHFELQNGKAFFLIEWDDYQNRQRTRKSYRFNYLTETIIDRR